MAWSKPQYSKGRVDWSGEVLVHNEIDFNAKTAAEFHDLEEAMAIVNNWRAVHSYPLQTMKMTLKRRAKRVCPNAIIAQRLKRMASIKLKLKLSAEAGQHPNLSQMQDIGGCRAVLDTVGQVRKVEKLFEEASKKNPKRGPQHSKTTDYIASPKPSGYRGIHLIYRFRSDSSAHSCYNGQRIEIQLRSRLQHYWATAVETYSTFSGEALKSNVGSEQWKRFFALVSSAIALKEGEAIVPGTYLKMDQVVPELKILYNILSVKNVLTGWAATAKFTAEATNVVIKKAAMYLLVLDTNTLHTSLYAYSREQTAAANAKYADIEKNQPDLQAVLVAVDSVAALRAAYPNYYLDTSSFLSLVDQFVK